MTPLLTAIIPVYNEARTLESMMHSLQQILPDAQRIFVDDGSSDGSRDILERCKKDGDLILLGAHGGKGSAIRLGLEQAAGIYTVIQDADLEYDPHDIALLLDEAKSHPGSAVFGSRFFHGKTPHLYLRFLMGNKVLTGWLNFLFGGALTDSYTCYKLIPTELFRSLQLTSNGFELEAEISAKCLKRKIPIREVPISYKPRSIEEGKKIRFADAWKGAMMMVKVRCS